MRKILSVFLLVLISACAVKTPLSDPQRYTQLRETLAKIPMVYPWQDALDDKRYINLQTPPYIYNSATLKTFKDKISKGLPAELIIVTYTDEGDPILKIVNYDGKTFLGILDTTRDRNGLKPIEEFKYTKWISFNMKGRVLNALFNRDVSYEEFESSMMRTNPADQIPNLFICFE
jgi:hypothetical protein